MGPATYLNVNIRRMNPNARIPQRKTSGAAAMDLYASEPLTIAPGSIGIVKTGLQLEIPHGYRGDIFSRSGLAAKGVWVANQPGKIDSDYRGEIMVILYNSTKAPFEVVVGDRVAQIEFQAVQPAMFTEVFDLSNTERGSGGLGSTGV